MKTFVLQPVDGNRIDYRPGQFLTLVFHGRNGQEERRSYSISSLPFDQSSLTITVKRVPNGTWSRILIDHTRVGDILETIGASGFFTLPEDLSGYRQLWFFAAGSGISPILPLIRYALHTAPTTRILLVYSNRTPSDTIFLQQIRELENTMPDRFAVEWLFSGGDGPGQRRLSAAFLQQLWSGQMEEPGRVYCFLCGPFEYMRTITIVLLAQGLPASHIRKEQFVIGETDTRLTPPDTNRHIVEIAMDGQRFQLLVQYPETILEAAKKAGVHLPYSCESGQCGTCAAQCISGKVWMRKNEVLLDEELIAGRVLTCTGFPVFGDVRLLL
ncbi:MAG TPA: iron-sulfur cluster-binding domain-containing protein [Sediminibacterium sp.]|nr:iron-sulfur cluster-binding domain-containing protein [Sediminibacterium sp.]